jgi:hypothetical protein
LAAAAFWMQPAGVSAPLARRPNTSSVWLPNDAT